MQYSRKELRMNDRLLQIKQTIPDSWFTKSGPGVERTAQLAVQNLSRDDRVLAAAQGWIPEEWIDGIGPRRTKLAIVGIPWTPPVESLPPPEENGGIRKFIQRFARGVKRLFGFGRGDCS